MELLQGLLLEFRCRRSGSKPERQWLVGGEGVSPGPSPPRALELPQFPLPQSLRPHLSASRLPRPGATRGQARAPKKGHWGHSSRWLDQAGPSPVTCRLRAGGGLYHYLGPLRPLLRSPDDAVHSLMPECTAPQVRSLTQLPRVSGSVLRNSTVPSFMSAVVIRWGGA